jgi:hypothetical protein
MAELVATPFDAKRQLENCQSSAGFHFARVLCIDIGRGTARLRAHFEFAERQVPLERK